MQFALDNVELSTVLVGFSDAEQVRQAAAIANDRYEATEERAMSPNPAQWP
jgi:predicted aldo/keto reductase-like oxidoreductase